MKRYLLFQGSDFYPAGGWFDFCGDYDTLSEARRNADRKPYFWFHIIDFETGEDVDERENTRSQDGRYFKP